jgi:hypothetical protein
MDRCVNHYTWQRNITMQFKTRKGELRRRNKRMQIKHSRRVGTEMGCRLIFPTP